MQEKYAETAEHMKRAVKMLTDQIAESEEDKRKTNELVTWYETAEKDKEKPKTSDLRVLARWMNHITAELEIMEHINRIILVLLQNTLALSATQADTKLQVSTNIEKELKAWLAQVEASRKNQEQYVR